ncbi:MAG TPA: YDG domain-containing protein [Mucilaginibacter sp.]|jgi:phosphotransferase system IIA component|nr:YDG domain-containing protein [Mucilaginibacter sp.]
MSFEKVLRVFISWVPKAPVRSLYSKNHNDPKAGYFFRLPARTTIFLIAFVLFGFSFSNSAFAVKHVSGVAYGTQSGSATYGTGCSCITYTITLTESGTSSPAADNIQLTWTGGTPTGVTWAFTSATESVTGGTTTTPLFTPSGSNSTITFTVTTSNSTPVAPLGSYGFTIKIIDNNLGGGPYSSSGLNLVVSPKTLTITGLAANNKTYDKTNIATLSGTATLNGVVGSDVVSLSGTPTSTFASANVGTGIAITVSGYTLTGANSNNYTLTQPTGLTANITAKTLTVVGALASNKTYDGTTTATVVGGILVGVILGDIVTVSGTGTFASPDVGNNIAVSIALSGANAGNYTLTQPGITANITLASLTITANNVSKPYGTTLTGGPGSTAFTASGLQNGQTVGSVTITYGTGSASTAAVGTYIGSITPGAATGGTFNTSDYSITYVTGKIIVTQAPLTITGLSGVNKVYDGTATATLSGTAVLNGVIGSDVVTLGGTPTATFPSKNVGTGLAITVTGYTILGANAGNYTLIQPTGLTGNITAKALTLTGASASNKVYDGTTTATISGTLNGVIGSDVVTLSPSGTFATKNVGTGIAVTSTSTLSGADAGNYTLTQPTGLTANITPKALTITGITASNKIYDGTTAGSLSGSAALSGVIGSDVVTLGGSGSATFASKSVGTGIAVTVTGYSISGGDAGNYTLTQPSGLTANITTATLVIAAIGPTKVTGSTSPVVTGSTSNFIYFGTVNGETVTSVTLTPSPTTSQSAGVTYTVTPSAAAGANGFLTSNYSITYSVYNGVCSGHAYTWNGNTSTTWSTSTNWTPSGTPTSTDDVIIPGSTARAPTVTATTTVNTIAFTGNNTITINSAVDLITNSGFTVNSGATSANVTFSGASTSTKLEISSAIFANFGGFNLSGTGLFQIDNNGSYIYNSGTFTAGGNSTLYLQGGSNVTHALTNAGTFYAGSSGSTCYIEMDDYGSIDNSGIFKLGPTSLMYFYNDNAQYVNLVNESGGTFTLQSDATGSASIGEVPQGKNNQFIGTFNVERYFQGSNTYSGGRWLERAYRIISSCVNTGSTVNSNYVYGLNYIVGSTAGQTTTANSSTNAFITGCTGGSTSAGNPSIYLYNESYTPSNATYVSGNFLGITNITNSTTGGTITASDGGKYSMPVGTGVLFWFRGAATNWATRTVSPYIAPENVTLSSTGNMNVGSYTYKDWYSPASSNLAYTGSGTGGNAAVRGFNMVGNPYPCAIDWLQFYSGSNGNVRTNIGTTIWEFNPVTYQYDTYTATSSSTGTGTGNASRYVASGQGFFVQATAASPKLTISEYAKVVWNASNGIGTGSVPAAAQMTGTSLLMSTTLPQESVEQSLRLKLVVDTFDYDDIFIGFNAMASNTYSPYEDGRYLPGSNAAEGLASISSDNVKLAINYLPLPTQPREEIKLFVTGRASGIYTFRRTGLKSIPQLYDIWLVDKYKKDSLDLRSNSTYAFNVNLQDTTSYGSNRFSVVISQNSAYAFKLLSFGAQKATGGALVTWTTQNEQNYTHFTVERSTDNGASFTVLGGISANASGQYSFLDKEPQLTTDIYRLRIEDINGAITYSNQVSLLYTADSNFTGLITVYPNPVLSTVNLSINAAPYGAGNQFVGGQLSNGNNNKAVYSIKITNSSGVLVKSESTSQQSWQADVKNLLPGTYIMQVYSADNRLMGKGTFVKL